MTLLQAAVSELVLVLVALVLLLVPAVIAVAVVGYFRFVRDGEAGSSDGGPTTTERPTDADAEGRDADAVTPGAPGLSDEADATNEEASTGARDGGDS